MTNDSPSSGDSNVFTLNGTSFLLPDLPAAAYRGPERSEVAEAEQTVARPDLVASRHPPRRIFMRRYFDVGLQSAMLLRVVVEETDTEMVVVTLYKTSKFKKYEEGET